MLKQALSLFFILLILSEVLSAQSQDSTQSPVPKDSVLIVPDSTQNDSTKIIVFDSLIWLKEQFILDSLKLDSVRIAIKDSLKRDSILKASPNIAVNISKRNRKFLALPEGVNYTFTDSSSIEADYYLALEEYFSTTFRQVKNKSLLSVKISPRNYRTTAYVRGLPLLQAEYLEKKEQKYNSKAEIDAFKKKQLEYFNSYVDIVVDIKTEFISVSDLNEKLFTIQLMSDDIIVKPTKITLLPIYSFVTEFVPWYQRRLILHLPRMKGGIDLWSKRKLSLKIELKEHNLVNEIQYQTFFIFELNPENRIDPKKVLNELNSN